MATEPSSEVAADQIDQSFGVEVELLGQTDRHLVIELGVIQTIQFAIRAEPVLLNQTVRLGQQEVDLLLS